MATKKTLQELGYNQFVSEVQKRAYEKYQERISKEKSGDTVSDWLIAEKELKKKYIVI